MRWIVCSVLCHAAIVFGQSPGNVYGKVTDPTGAPIPHATITIRTCEDKTQQDESTQTDVEGNFNIPGRNGTCEAHIWALGFGNFDQRVQVLAGQNLRLDVTLPIGNIADPPSPSKPLNLEWGVQTQGGFGVTENRSSFKFLMAGFHAGRVLSRTPYGNFEYGVELWPLWQSYTPVSQRQTCVLISGSPGLANCSAPYKVGGTYTGASVTPIILRWNFARGGKWRPWVQGAGGVVWTNHKYPAVGGPPVNSGGVTNSSVTDNAANVDSSVWNFTPQFGVGMHYFTHPYRSIDFAANAIHISSASLGDKNPGVNASVQFTVGYTWWK